MTQRVVLESAFVLHSRAYGNTSSIVDLLSLSHGRICAIARGARTIKSRFRGVLRPFVPLLVSWSGTTELMNLTVAEASSIPKEFNGKTLLSGIYLNELLVRLLHRYDPYPEVFLAYQQTLVQLQGQNTELVLRQFEKKLLAQLGYGLPLDKEAETAKPIMADAWYYFDPRRGLFKCPMTKLSANTFQGKHLLALHAGAFDNLENLRAAKQLMRLAIESLLGKNQLKSRELFPPS